MPRDDRWEVFSGAVFVDDDKEDEVGIGVTCGRRSFSYYRLPEPLLKLSVLKLDGSSFDVKIARTDSVRELKLAVEEVFSQLPKAGGVQISWPHVWSYFCLCYEDHKLTDDRASLQSFGIKDGIQLHFVRQLTLDHRTVLKKHRRSSTAPEVLENFQENVTDVGPSQCSDEKLHHNYQSNEDLVEREEFRLSHLLMRLFSYAKLPVSGRRRSEGMPRSSRSAGNFQRLSNGDSVK